VAGASSSVGGEQKHYVPDSIVHLDDGRGSADPLQLIVEVTGQARPDKQAKTDTAEKLWGPAVNNAAQWGRWAFVEITDPWDAMEEIREMAGLAQHGGKDASRPARVRPCRAKRCCGVVSVLCPKTW